MRKTANKRIGFLITGSEITSGEVLNSNSARMAELLQEQGVVIGEHILCDDGLENLEAAFQFLLSRHDAVITSGGLGPTSDDITRVAVAKVAGQKLVFHEASWQKIVDRMAKRNSPIPKNNRQQAFFPAGSTVLKNDRGTADACLLKLKDQLIFMLPGPPRECLPIFEQQVFPLLNAAGFASPLRLFRWRLMGVSESIIAEAIDPICAEFEIEFAYRASYPFVDVKLMLNPHHKNHSRILLAVEKTVKPYFATHLNETLTQQLRNLILETKQTLFVEDQATHGYFLQKMALPIEAIASYKQDASISVVITGLDHFWIKDHKQVFDQCEVEITLLHKKECYAYDKILLRGQETLDFVAEFTALKILHML